MSSSNVLLSAPPEKLYPELSRIGDTQKKISTEIEIYRKVAKNYKKAQTAKHYPTVGLGSLWATDVEQGWRSVESTRFPPMWPGFKSRRRRHMWVEFVVGSLLCSERFFAEYSGFPLSSKTNIFKFQCDQKSLTETKNRYVHVLHLNSYLINLFIYLDSDFI